MKRKYFVMSAVVFAMICTAAAFAAEPSDLVFTQKQGGKYIYCNNHELIRSCDLADRGTENAKFLMNNENLGKDRYALFASFLNRTDIDSKDKSSGGRGFDIELDVMFKAETDTEITIEKLGFEVPEHRTFFLNGTQYSAEDEWGCFSCWASYLNMPIKQINSGNVYEPAEFNEVSFTVEAGETVWLSQFISNYREIPFCRSVNIMSDFVIESGECDVNIAAFRSNGTLGDRSNLSPNAAYGSYYRDRQYKGVSDGLNEVTANLSYTIDDSMPVGKLPVKVYNQYCPDGNVITDWYTHLNPRADQWSYALCAESDMLAFDYYDPNKKTLYGNAVAESEKDDYYHFDTRHTDISVYNKAYGSKNNYIPNRELKDGEGTEYACNLGNYGVIYNYDIEITNNGNKKRYLIYKLATSSNNLVYVKDSGGNVVNDTVLSKGKKETRISDDMACVGLPAQQTSRFTVCVILTPNYAGGMQNSFYLSDTPSLAETYETERGGIVKDRYFTGRKFYNWNGGKLNLISDSGEAKTVELPKTVMDGIRGNLSEFSVIYTGDGYVIRPSLYDAGWYLHADHLFRDVYLLDEDFNLKAVQTFGAYPRGFSCANGVYYVNLSGTVFRSTQFKWWDVTDHVLPCWNYGEFSLLCDKGIIKLSLNGIDFDEVVYTDFKPEYVDSYGEYYYYIDKNTLYLSHDAMQWRSIAFDEKLKSFTVKNGRIVSDKGEEHDIPEFNDVFALKADGKYISMTAEPLFVNNNPMLPLKSTAAVLGYDAVWENGEVYAVMNGERIKADMVIINDTAYVTPEEFEKLTSSQISWDESNRILNISSN